jgi:hypothetical protein
MRNVLNTTAMVTLGLALSFGVALAQQQATQPQGQKQAVSFKVGANDSKYKQQLNVDVGDVPGHVVRIFEIERTYQNNPPMINGLKVSRSSARGIADYISGNGPTTIYEEYVMENGDKFWVRSSLISRSNSQTANFHADQVGFITGGTGKMAGLHGMEQSSVNFNPQTGFNEAEISFDIQ